jgi:hypothetical protein
MWFAQAEAQFRRARITAQTTMYDYVLMKLPEDVVMSVRALVSAIETDPVKQEASYTLIKEALMGSYGKTKWQMAYALLDHPDLGDRRPSAMMAEMLALRFETSPPDSLFLALFLRRLPASILDPDKLKIAEAEFRSLEAAGIVRRSNSPWSSPLHMVPKADGSWRPCGDYRRLNTVTTPDRYPLPSMLDLSAKLHGCKFFSCVDLIKGYNQIPMAAEDIEKTAIITPFGLFEYLFMPFGLTNAAQSFQRLMDKLFRHLPFVFTYLDDHLIASRTLEEHLLHLQQFFQVLQENG